MGMLSPTVRHPADRHRNDFAEKEGRARAQSPGTIATAID